MRIRTVPDGDAMLERFRPRQSWWKKRKPWSRARAMCVNGKVTDITDHVEYAARAVDGAQLDVAIRHQDGSATFVQITTEELLAFLKAANDRLEMPRMVPAQRPADVSEPDIDRLRENLRRAQEEAGRRNDDD